MFAQLNKIRAVSAISARSNLAYPSELFGRAIFLFVILYIFAQLWRATYAASSDTRCGGMTIKEMLWYLALTESMYMSAPRLARQVDEDVRSGQIALRLLKPMSYPLYCLATTMGERLVRFVFNFAVSAVVVFVMVGPLEADSRRPFVIILLVTLAFVMDTLGNMFVGLLAFDIEDTSGILLIYTRLTMILGGVMLPAALFPDWLSRITVWLPFTYMVAGPAALFVHPAMKGILDVLACQLVWLAFGFAALTLAYRRVQDKLTANGG